MKTVAEIWPPTVRAYYTASLHTFPAACLLVVVLAMSLTTPTRIRLPVCLVSSDEPTACDNGSFILSEETNVISKDERFLLESAARRDQHPYHHGMLGPLA